MSLNASVGFSEGEDSYAVGANAAQEALEKLGLQTPHAAIVLLRSI